MQSTTAQVPPGSTPGAGGDRHQDRNDVCTDLTKTDLSRLEAWEMFLGVETSGPAYPCGQFGRSDGDPPVRRRRPGAAAAAILPGRTGRLSITPHMDGADRSSVSSSGLPPSSLGAQ